MSKKIFDFGAHRALDDMTNNPGLFAPRSPRPVIYGTGGLGRLGGMPVIIDPTIPNGEVHIIHGTSGQRVAINHAVFAQLRHSTAPLAVSINGQLQGTFVPDPPDEPTEQPTLPLDDLAAVVRDEL